MRHSFFFLYNLFKLIVVVFFVAPQEEVTEIRGRKVHGVGFGNIFGGGPINLRPAGPHPARKEPAPLPDGDRDKPTHEVPKASVS